MRILLISDLHGRQPAFDFVLSKANEFDAICIPGDLLDMSPRAKVRLASQAESVVRWLRAFPRGRAHLFVTSGNHDWWPGDDGLAEGRWLQHARGRNVSVDGDVTTVEGMTFVCCGWNEPIKVPAAGRVILLQHAPPEGTLVASGECGDEGGDFELRSAIVTAPPGRLQLVFSGHVHEPILFGEFVASTLCLNPGCDLDATVPRHIIVDTCVRRASMIQDGITRGSVCF